MGEVRLSFQQAIQANAWGFGFLGSGGSGAGSLANCSTNFPGGRQSECQPMLFAALQAAPLTSQKGSDNQSKLRNGERADMLATR